MIDVRQLNPWAIGAGALVSFLVGGVWYTFLFSKPWMAALGINQEDVGDSGIPMGPALLGSVMASLLTAIGLALILSRSEAPSWTEALAVAGLAWLAFSMTPMVKMAFWEDRPWTLIAIDGGYELASILAITGILVTWR